MSLLFVTHLASVGTTVTGEITALIPCSVSEMSNLVLIGALAAVIVWKYKPLFGFNIASNPLDVSLLVVHSTVSQHLVLLILLLARLVAPHHKRKMG